MIEPVDVLEALLFASDTPVEAALIQEVLELPSADAARELVQRLLARFEEQRRVLTVIEAGGGFRLVTRPEVAPWLVKLARSKTRNRLSRPALETLAIIAYRQPVSRPEVDATRGVNSEGVLDNLLERRLIRIAGRKDSPGRPFLYETTREFLVAFGLRDLGDLPKVDGELTVIDPAPAAGADAPAAPDDADAIDPPLDSDGASAALSFAPRDAPVPPAFASPAQHDAGAALEQEAEVDRPAAAGSRDDVGAAGTAPARSRDAGVTGGAPAAPGDAPAGAAVAKPSPGPEDAVPANASTQQDPLPGGADVAPRG